MLNSLYPEKMKKIRIFALKSIEDELIDFLHRKGLLHLEKPQIKINDFGTFSWYKEISSLAVKFRGIAKLLSIKERKNEVEKPSSLIKKAKNLEKKLEGIEEMAKNLKLLEEEREDLREKLKEVELYNSFYSKRIPESLNLYAIKIKKPEEEKEIKKLNPLFYKKLHHKGEIIILALLERRIPSIGVEAFEYPKEGLKNKVEELRNKLKEIENKIEEIKAKIEKTKVVYGEEIGKILFQLNIYTDRALASEKFKGSEHFIIIEGWIPAKSYKSFIEELKEKFSSNLEVKEVKGGEPPTLLKNPKETKQFQEIVEMISLPKGNEIDPTKLFALTIPLIYGMIIGDVIYSLFSIFFASYLMKKFRDKLLLTAAKVWLYSSFAGIIWGVIFDEWLGVSHFYWFEKLSSFGIEIIEKPLYKGFSRSHYLPLLIIASIIIGILHLALAFFVAFLHERKHSKKHALAKLGFFIFLLAFPALIISTIAEIQALTILSALATLASVIMIGRGEGIVGLIEIPSVLGNVVSYSRIAVVGIVGVIIAENINEFLSPSPESGLVNFLLFILFITLHAFNAILAMFESLIQGARLNLVEFGTKIYKGGGKRYNPFRMLNKK